MAEMELGQGVAALQSRAKIAEYAIVAVIAATVLLFLTSLLEFFGMVDYNAQSLDDLSLIAGLIAVAFILMYLISAVTVCMWIYRAHDNLRAAGFELEYTPGWSVGWYFIPFANLIMPFNVMKEQWNTTFSNGDSYTSEAPSIITMWWVSYVVGSIFGNIGGVVQEASNYTGSGNTIGIFLNMGSAVLTIVSAWCLLTLIRQITAGHRDGLVLSDTFT